MPLIRLLAIALLVCPFTAFGQAKQNDGAPATQQVAGATTPAAPWRIVPSDASHTQRSILAVAPGTSQQQGITLEDVPRTAPPDTNSVVLPSNNFVFSPGTTTVDTYCLRIRSYVMARDSKDSDSTHLVSYSTCQPASKYRLKSVELQSQPASR